MTDNHNHSSEDEDDDSNSDNEEGNSHSHSHGSHSHGHSHSHKKGHSHSSHQSTSSPISLIKNKQKKDKDKEEDGDEHQDNNQSFQSLGIIEPTNKSRYDNNNYDDDGRLLLSPNSPINNDNTLLLNDDKSNQELKRKRNARIALLITLVLTTIFMIGEIIGGYVANSLAIMTDAAHLLTDIGAMFLSLFAMWISTHPPTSKLSFGFHRAEILGALASVLMIWALTGVLIYEAIQRVRFPPDVVDGKVMFIVATSGLFINIVDALILHFGAGGHGHSHGGGGGGHSHGGQKKKKKNHKHKHNHSHNDHGHNDQHINVDDDDDEQKEINVIIEDLGLKKDKKNKSKIKMDINVYSTYIHIIGDCFQSIGVMIASVIIWVKPHWKIADPITTFIFSIIVLFTTIRLLRHSLGVLMEGVPADIDVEEVQEDLERLQGVTEVHDLHIWSITHGKPALSVHLTVGQGVVGDDVLQAANRLLLDHHNIDHTTIQIELHNSKELQFCRDPCATPRKSNLNVPIQFNS